MTLKETKKKFKIAEIVIKPFLNHKTDKLKAKIFVFFSPEYLTEKDKNRITSILDKSLKKEKFQENRIIAFGSKAWLIYVEGKDWIELHSKINTIVESIKQYLNSTINLVIKNLSKSPNEPK